MFVRKLEELEIPEAASLVWEVFSEFEAPEYSIEGVKNFRKFLKSDEEMSSLAICGAFDGEKLVGVAATRSDGSHISLFFVKKQYHRQGIGRLMFNMILQSCSSDTITVNSSPYAVNIYRRLGFVSTADEQVENGIRFIPMVYSKT